MNKCYYRIVWENYPSDKTPLNEQNLNRMDAAVDEMDNRIISLDSTKFDKSEAQLLVKYIEYDESTGIFKITHYNGASYTIDTLLEKLAINFDYDYRTQKLIIELSDGTVKYVDLSALITQYEFVDSGTIAYTVYPDGSVTSEVKEGSIEERHLRPDYLADIKVESAKAEASQKAAAQSEANAKKSENAAKVSETNAAESAKNSEDSATSAGQSAAESAISAAAAKESETNAKNSENAAKASEDSADASKVSASASAERASTSASTATAKATEAQNYAGLSQSFSKGTGGEIRENDDTDCAEYYYNQTKKISQSFTGVVPMGTITFEDLDNPDNQQSGYMFNISDSFVSDDRFKDGGGIFYGAGNNVLYTADGMWDVLASAMVSGVKGNKEKEYRQGFVNLTPDNIGSFPDVERVVESATDLNDYLTSGIYFFSQTRTPINIPEGVNGWLVVYPRYDSAFVKQIWYKCGTIKTNGDISNDDHKTFVRTYFNGAWSEWKSFAMGEDVQIATTKKAGIVKPDGKTITVDDDGTIVGAASGFTGTKEEVREAIENGEIAEDMIVNITDDYDPVDIFDDALSATSENAVKNKVITAKINQVDSVLNNIGITMFNSLENAIPTKTGSSTKVLMLDLNQGTYVLTGNVSWRNNTHVGRRQVALRLGEYFNSTLISGNESIATDGTIQYQSCTGIVSSSQNMNISFWVIQSSGEEITIDDANLQAIKIK